MTFLFVGNGGWNKELIQLCFLHDDAVAILRIKLPRYNMMMRSFEILIKKRVFFFLVKSVCFLGLKIANCMLLVRPLGMLLGLFGTPYERLRFLLRVKFVVGVP